MPDVSHEFICQVRGGGVCLGRGEEQWQEGVRHYECDGAGNDHQVSHSAFYYNHIHHHHHHYKDHNHQHYNNNYNSHKDNDDNNCDQQDGISGAEVRCRD